MARFIVRKYAFFLTAILVSQLSCSDSNFKGSAREAKQPDPPITPDNVDLSFTVIAGENLTIPFDQLGIEAAPSLNEDNRKLLPGLRLGDDNASLTWPSDYQDLILKERKGFLDLKAEDGSLLKSVNLKVEILDPKFLQTKCEREIKPVIGDVQPVLKWHSDGQTKNGIVYHSTYSAPVVGDLDGDFKPEVVTVLAAIGVNYYSYDFANPHAEIIALLEVLDGETGDVLWDSFQINAPTPPVKIVNISGDDQEVQAKTGYGALPSSTPALMDLDGDGKVEIIVASANRLDQRYPSVVVYSYSEKKVKYEFTDDGKFFCSVYCSPTVADIDGDGKAEIIAGNAVLNHEAKLKFYFNDTTGLPNHFISAVGDLAPEHPGLEIVIGGSKVFNAKGEFLSSGECAGFPAISDLDKDGKAELVCTYKDPDTNIKNGTIYVYERENENSWGQARLRWSQVLPTNPSIANYLSKSNAGGAPNIGDFTGDGFFEIGIAGGFYYLVYDRNGNELWRKETQDYSSSKTGSSIFDLNGDGKVEVLYNDETHFRIYNGQDGSVLYEFANPSGTLWEYPVVANVDQDASVEIILSAPGAHNNKLANTGGIKVLDHPENLWVTSRKIWNQYSYYPELVSDQYTAVKNPGLPKTGFRVNSQGSISDGKTVKQANLKFNLPQFLDDAADKKQLSLFVSNIGHAKAEVDGRYKVQVVDKPSGKILGTTALTAAIEAGSAELLSVKLESMTQGREVTIKLVGPSSSNNPLDECRLDDNQISTMPLDRR